MATVWGSIEFHFFISIIKESSVDSGIGHEEAWIWAREQRKDGGKFWIILERAVQEVKALAAQAWPFKLHPQNPHKKLDAMAGSWSPGTWHCSIGNRDWRTGQKSRAIWSIQSSKRDIKEDPVQQGGENWLLNVVLWVSLCLCLSLSLTVS